MASPIYRVAHRAVLVAACLLLGVVASAARAGVQRETAAHSLVITHVEARDLTGDRTLESRSADSLIRRVLALDELEAGSPARGITDGFVAIPGVFRLSDRDDESGISILFEREIAYYGPYNDLGKFAGATWLFGILGAAATSTPSTMVMVQWRATARMAGVEEPLVVVSQGGRAGDARWMPRRDGMLFAEKAALYLLAHDLIEAFDGRLGLKIKRRSVNDDEAGYRSKSVDW